MAFSTHGHHTGGRTPTYITWQSMHARCRYPGNASYAHYGARGVSVCDRWRSFAAFLEDMGERPAGQTLDRVDPNGHYEPNNCRWATASEQRRNQRGSTARIERARVIERLWADGRSLKDIAAVVGMTPGSIRVEFARLRAKGLADLPHRIRVNAVHDAGQTPSG